MRYKLRVKYRNDDYYTTIMSPSSRGSMREVTKFLDDNYAFMNMLAGGVEKVKIVPAKDGE